MLITKKRPWEAPEREATPEEVFFARRKFLKTMGAFSIGAGLLTGFNGGFLGIFDFLGAGEETIRLPRTPTSDLYPAMRNRTFTLDRPLTEEAVAAMYNNFYEFSSRKDVWRHVEDFPYRPWTVEVGGLVEKRGVFDIDELVRKMPLEERLYRLRCVEAWAMAVPWTGFPMREFIKLAKPLGSAKFVKFTSFHNPSLAPGQRFKFWAPWPYTEGLTMEEAANELTLLVTGIYGHELPAQHGAPIRLIVPWKYGFKSIKSITRIEFTETRPETFWNTLVPQEYGFESNVEPDVPHPRWSQKTERIIGTDEVRPTIKYNGYGEYVSRLY